MGRDKVNVLEERLNPGPELLKGRLPGNIIPFEAVNVGEVNFTARRSNQKVLALDNPLPVNFYETNRTGAIRFIVSGFKINCQEISLGGGGGRGHGGFTTRRTSF